MLIPEAIDILKKSNVTLLKNINQLQKYPIKAMDKKMQEKSDYTLKNALLEIEAVEMATAALGSEAGQSVSILATFPETDCTPELITFKGASELNADTLIKAFEFVVKNGLFGDEDRLSVLDSAVQHVEDTFQCRAARTEIYTVEVW